MEINVLCVCVCVCMRVCLCVRWIETDKSTTSRLINKISSSFSNSFKDERFTTIRSAMFTEVETFWAIFQVSETHFVLSPDPI